jgi:hypothetical protein
MKTSKRPGVGAATNEESSLSIQADAILADKGFFDVFDFKILTGAKGDALNTASNVFLTPKAAKALFGEENPLGKSLTFGRKENVQVAGIVETPPLTPIFNLILFFLSSRNEIPPGGIHGKTSPYKDTSRLTQTQTPPQQIKKCARWRKIIILLKSSNPDYSHY